MLIPNKLNTKYNTFCIKWKTNCNIDVHFDKFIEATFSPPFETVWGEQQLGPGEHKTIKKPHLFPFPIHTHREATGKDKNPPHLEQPATNYIWRAKSTPKKNRGGGDKFYRNPFPQPPGELCTLLPCVPDPLQPS